MLGSVLYLNNVTNSNIGVFPGRFDGDCVRGRVENLMIFFCIKKKKKPLQQLAKYLNIKILWNKEHFSYIYEKGGKALFKGLGWVYL